MLRHFLILFSLTITLSLSGYVKAQNCVYQVEDFVPGVGGALPVLLTEFNSEIVFRAANATYGTELFKYDGSTISLIADINPGSGSSNPINFEIHGSDLYFTATDGSSGMELWKYDGTNVTQVADIWPGGGGSMPFYLTSSGSYLYFSANDGTSGTELWRYNGVSATMVADINPGFTGGFPTEITAYGSGVCFFANDGATGFEFYYYDGSTANLVDINPGSANSNPADFEVVGSDIYFRATTATQGIELIKYDGSTATILDLNPGSGNFNPWILTNYNGDLYFRGYTTTEGDELCKYDGSTLTVVADIKPGTQSSFPDNFQVLGSDLYFIATSTADGRELWKYDGTNTTLTTNVAPGNADAFGSTTPPGFAKIGNDIFFVASDGTTGFELWKFDGTTAELSRDIYQGSGTSNPNELLPYNSKLYFSAEEPAGGNELWVWDPVYDLTSDMTVVSCGDYTTPSGTLYTNPGNYTVYDTLPSVSCPSCDSIITIDLSIAPTITYYVDTLSCGSYTTYTGTTYNGNGSYNFIDTIPSIAYPGCDSIVEVDLTITTLSTAVTVLSNVIVAQANGALYQWLDCDNNYAPIPGETDQDFIATSSGSYAVQLTLGDCIDTSACKQIIVQGIDDNTRGEIQIYPNPVRDKLNIFQENGEFLNITIADGAGKVIIKSTTSDELTEIDMSKVSKGIYYVVLSNSEYTFTQKVIVD